MPSSAILLLEQDAATADLIRAALEHSGHAMTIVDDPAEAIRLADDHVLVMVDVAHGERTAESICSELKAPTPSGHVASLVLAVAQSDDIEERIRLFEAGADDVIVKPFDDRELEAKVEALLVRVRRAGTFSGATAAVTGGRRVVAFFSPKGGVGTTTLAVNVALAAAEQRPDHTAFIDLDLRWGQAATHFDIRPRQTLAELSRDSQALAEPELLRSYTERREPGLDVLCAPANPELGSLLSPAQVGSLLAGARSVYDVVIVDAGSSLDERTQAIFEAADAVVFVVQPEIAALKALHSLLELLSDNGAAVGKTVFVLNHLFAREMLKLQDIETSLGAKITLEIPHEPVLYVKAVNEGIPILRGAPKSPPAERLRRLATLLVGETSSEAGSVSPGSKPRGLGGILKRG